MKKNDDKKKSKVVPGINAIEIKGTKKKVFAKIISDIKKDLGKDKCKANSSHTEYVAWDEEGGHSEVIHGDT